MVVSGYVQCTTCNSLYRSRIGMGSEMYQVHSFDCHECALPISIGLRKVDVERSLGRIEAEENSRIVDGEPEEAVVINLHASVAFDADEFHDPRAFPSLLFIQKILPHTRLKEGEKYQDVALLFEVPNCKTLWGYVKSTLALVDRNPEDRRIERFIRDYRSQRERCIGSIDIEGASALLGNFFDAMFYPRIGLLVEPLRALIYELRNVKPEEFSRFLAFYKDELWGQSYSRNISLFTDYFRAFTEFSQMLMYARIDDQNVEAKIVGSKGFENTKLFYGQAFETITSGFSLLASLNNMLSGRAFDQFEQMTLQKYLRDVDKANRANPFKENPVLYRFSEHLDSTLRNGSHHASIWRDGETVFYRSGGAGAERDMPYAKYLHLCNELMISCAALFVVEYELMAQ